METKTCRDCNTTKSTMDFYKNRGGYHSYCKPCSSKRSSEDQRKRKSKNSLKVCKICNEEHPLDNFSFSRGYPISYCKPCNSKKANDRYHRTKNSTMFFMSNQWNITV